MVNVMYLSENEDYHHNLFFFGNDKDVLEIIREQINADGDVWTLEEYPLIIKQMTKKFSLFTEYKYFFFRVMYDIDYPERYMSYVDNVDLATLMINKDKNIIKYQTHENKYARLISEGVMSGKFDNISFGKLSIESNPTLNLPPETKE